MAVGSPKSEHACSSPGPQGNNETAWPTGDISCLWAFVTFHKAASASPGFPSDGNRQDANETVDPPA